MTLEDQIKILVNNYQQSEDLKIQKSLYTKIVNLSSIFIRTDYPSLPHSAVDDISHDVASSIIINLHKSFEVWAWGKYIKQSTRNTTADWLKLNVYSQHQSIEDIEQEGLNIVYNSNNMYSSYLVEVTSRMSHCSKNITKILNSIPMVGYKKNITKLIILNYSQGVDYLRLVPSKYHGMIRLLSYLITNEIIKMTRHINAQY